MRRHRLSPLFWMVSRLLASRQSPGPGPSDALTQLSGLVTGEPACPPLSVWGLPLPLRALSHSARHQLPGPLSLCVLLLPFHLSSTSSINQQTTHPPRHDQRPTTNLIKAIHLSLHHRSTIPALILRFPTTQHHHIAYRVPRCPS